MKPFSKSKRVDVMIIAEGTFPYIKGGVSSWIYQLINGLKEFTFGIIFIGSRPEDYTEVSYDIPENLVYFNECFIFDTTSYPPPKKIKSSRKELELVNSLHDWFAYRKGQLPKEVTQLEFYNKYLTEKKISIQ
jgi:hypothetical protein